jgi:two-component system, chemotaxis family, CheB/CheR fusion protein
VSVATDIAERKAMEDQANFLLRELSHRSRNLLTVVQAIAELTVRNAASLETFKKAFIDRLRALAASNDLLTANPGDGVPLDRLIRRQLAPFVDLSTARVEIDGPETSVSADATQSIGLALHELATNAVKYGALSSPNGKIRIRWGIEHGDGELVLRLRWTECGAPPVVEPTRKGFGQIVVKQMIESALSGSVQILYEPTGILWSLTAPMSGVRGRGEREVSGYVNDVAT